MNANGMGAGVIVAIVAGAAQAQFFDTTSTANGDWAAAAGGPIVELDFSRSPTVPLTAGVPVDLGEGVSITANGDGVDLDGLGLTADFIPGAATELTFTFDVAITAISWAHFNSFVSSGITVDTGLGAYDVEVLEGGGAAVSTIGFVGIVEGTGFSSVTFRLSDPAVSDLWFIDTPLRFVRVPAPGAAALAAGGLLVAARRRR